MAARWPAATTSDADLFEVLDTLGAVDLDDVIEWAERCRDDAAADRARGDRADVAA